MLRRSERKRTPALLPGDVAPSLAEKAKSVVRCDDVWEKGVPTKPAEDYPVWMKPSKNCAIPVDGKYAYVSPPPAVTDLETYIREVERVDTAEGFRGKSGVYTWILYRTKDESALKFGAGHVNSVIELGTLHHALARGTGAVTVHGAGELKKRDASKHEILVNFQSGSFMEKWILPEDTCTLPEMERFLLAKLREVLKGLRVETPRKASFITDELTPPTMEELKSYAARGFKVCLYDTAAECKAGKGTCSDGLAAEKKQEDITMPKKGGKIIGIGYDGAELPVADPRAQKWFDTNTYKELTKQQALGEPVSKENVLGQMKKESVPPGSPLRPSRPAASIGLGRKTRRGKKARKVTRKSKLLRGAVPGTRRY